MNVELREVHDGFEEQDRVELFVEMAVFGMKEGEKEDRSASSATGFAVVGSCTVEAL